MIRKSTNLGAVVVVVVVVIVSSSPDRQQGKIPVPAAFLDVYRSAKDLMAVAYPGGNTYDGKILDLQSIRRRPVLEDSVHTKLVSGSTGPYASKVF